MRASQLVSALIFSASVCADSTKVFYAKLDDKFMPLSGVRTAALEFVSPSDRSLPAVPKFTLKNGIAISGDGDDARVFGVIEGYVVLGTTAKVNPLKFSLNSDSKVVNRNLDPHLCHYSLSRVPPVLMGKDYSSLVMKCSKVDLYFMSPSEAARHKREIEEEQTSEERDEQIISFFNLKVNPSITSPVSDDPPEAPPIMDSE